MNCRDAERLIDTFFDGELDGRLMREAALHVTRCKRCEAEIVDRERIHDLLNGAIADDLALVDVDQIWTGVAAAIGDAPQRRRGERVESAPLRLAAASTRMSGILLGGRRADAGAALGAAADDLDPTGQWLRPQALISRRGSWGLAAGAALAASLVAAVLLNRDPTSTSTGAQVAAGGNPTSPVGAVAMVSPVASQVQVESVDYSGRSLAMWTEPETDTTVIWVDDEDPGAAR